MAQLVTMGFLLEEDVTPELLGMRVAQACAKFGCLRVGEAIVVGEQMWVRMSEDTLMDREQNCFSLIPDFLKNAKEKKDGR